MYLTLLIMSEWMTNDQKIDERSEDDMDQFIKRMALAAGQISRISGQRPSPKFQI